MVKQEPRGKLPHSAAALLVAVAGPLLLHAAAVSLPNHTLHAALQQQTLAI